MTRSALALVMFAGLGAGCHEVFGTGVPTDAPPIDARPPPPTSWATVASGLWHTCAIRIDGTLWCWGRNDNGELGQERISINSETSTPVKVGVAANWASAASSGSTTCAITTADELFCWGLNSNQQVSPMAMQTVAVPNQIVGSYKVVATGAFHTCAIDLDGAAFCWGGNGSGQLGIGSTLPSSSPVPVGNAVPYVWIGAGVSSTCALTVDGAAWCWGINGFGQLGNGNRTLQMSPVEVIGGHVFSQLAVGWRHACGRTTVGQLRCWGENSEGQLGNGTIVERTQPTPVEQDMIIDWLDVHAGHSHTCARRASGQPYCWGGNSAGQLAMPGAGDVQSTPLPLIVDTATVRAMGLGFRRTCVVNQEHALSCTGHAGTGALGIAGEGSRRSPTPVAGTWGRVVAGVNLTCGLDPSGAMSCWGNNEKGAVGDLTQIDRAVPTAVANVAPVNPIDIALGEHACVIAPDLSMYCWGDNQYGQLGAATPPSQPTPTRVNITGQTQWRGLAGQFQTCATAPTGELWCWGHNESGECGVTASMTSVPRQPTAPGWPGTIWKLLAAGNAHTCAINATDDLPYCWGSNVNSQLGFQGANSISPVLVTGGKAEAIAAGGQHTCSLLVGALRCWGRNDVGQVGDMTGQQANTPKLIAGVWSAVTAGEAHTCGLKGGAVWCWGANDSGQLGDGTLATRFGPVQIGTDTDWVAVAAGRYHTCARKAGDQLWCWGSNRRGEIGDGTAWRDTLETVVQP